MIYFKGDTNPRSIHSRDDHPGCTENRMGRISAIVPIFLAAAVFSFSALFIPGSLSGQSAGNEVTSDIPFIIKGAPHLSPLNLEFSPDGKALLVGHINTYIQWFDPATGKLLRQINNGHADKVYKMGFSFNGKIIASASLDSRIIIRDPVSGKLIKTINTKEPIDTIGIDPTGSLICISENGNTNDKGMVSLWDANAGKMLWRTRIPNAKESTTRISFSHDAKMIATSSMWGKDVHLWNSSDGSFNKTIPVAWQGVACMTFSPSENVIATSDRQDGAGIKLWNPSTGELIKILNFSPAIIDLNFSRDGRKIAGCFGDRTVKVWDVESGVMLKNLIVKSPGGGFTYSEDTISFSPDGKKLASVSTNGSLDGLLIRIWDLE